MNSPSLSRVARPRRGVKGAARGFTLIELLVVITLIGLLAVIALPRFSGAREKAYRSQMQTDLRTLVSAQEAYFDSNHAYASNVSDLEFNNSSSVTIQIEETQPNGWSARATHTSTSLECGVYFGSATPPGGIPLPDDGIIGCT